MVSCVPGAMVAIARKCKPLDPSEAVWRTTTQLASPGGARFFTNSLPTYVWKRVTVVGADLRATRGGASGPARASRGALGPRRVEAGRGAARGRGKRGTFVDVVNQTAP